MKSIFLFVVFLASAPLFAYQLGACSITANHCVNNGTFSAANCACDCTNATACKNGAQRSSDGSCGCVCSRSWSGIDCGTCSLNPSSCVDNSNFRPGSCDCDCAHVDCVNGDLDSTCQCICHPTYAGYACNNRDAFGGMVAGGVVGAGVLTLVAIWAYQLYKGNRTPRLPAAAGDMPLEIIVAPSLPNPTPRPQYQSPPESDGVRSPPNFPDYSKPALPYSEAPESPFAISDTAIL